jgi:hypothetical protein
MQEKGGNENGRNSRGKVFNCNYFEMLISVEELINRGV